jgi:two-component system, cell cycle response regulator CpdR
VLTFTTGATLPAQCGEGIVARILLAEDEEALRRFIVRALTEEGHEVVAVADGVSALDVLARDRGRFQLLLTDVRMPVMDGIALALNAARDHSDLIILLMTGFADQRERAHGLDALVHDVITKPFSIAEIKHAVKGALVTHATR